MSERSKARDAVSNSISATYNQMEQQYRYGLVTEKVWKMFLFAWSWCAPRFGGDAGRQQDKFYDKHGKGAYQKRINRVRRFFRLEPYFN